MLAPFLRQTASVRSSALSAMCTGGATVAMVITGARLSTMVAALSTSLAFRIISPVLYILNPVINNNTYNAYFIPICHLRSLIKNTLNIEKRICIKKKKNSSSTNLTSYTKICKPVFHNVLYCIIMFMHCIYT